ncbi:hypothetical protein CLAFUW4_13766 [Fulvia fulva]|uniref:Mediator of RNA polymerase II transcription subunit 18 n=1 Tax=Passalora fulva TaxID=5499 RepID=A0A9Q8PLE6_PASFU|nr:uncharacterized protein CLAFUR5_13613 [Fulvia fulva]KAK4610717.1 hypothetical protein CLAFUR4_13769 [Fulvia fulva]KAK4611127.1 hypothetical protein CLAFUR0_13773 [Fulvia fulva]UJO24681.1 hypothetical protein CLAFUR5_13613 [Fulvia fulva]WPV21739.1 hypothetical protein CLAFUW4_13766 [Fulvia fulva]WPV36889.1 hypothetical protein CLAFUW7_13774 [Fulvia fulva]
MHEYILYSHIPYQREKQVLGILAGLTGVQPVEIHEQVLIYAQVKVPEVAVSKKVRQTQQLPKKPDPAYHKIWREVVNHDNGTASGGEWHFRAEQTPEPGVATFISRGVTEHKATEAELERLKQPEWYQFKRYYGILGYRFVHNNVIIRVYRMIVPIELEDREGDGLIEAGPRPADLMKLVDASGSLIVEALVRVATFDKPNPAEDRTKKDKQSVADTAKKELLGLQAAMDGAVDLYAPDRLALETRARNV